MNTLKKLMVSAMALAALGTQINAAPFELHQAVLAYLANPNDANKKAVENLAPKNKELREVRHNGMSVLGLAIQQGNVKLIETLLAAGADVQARCCNENISPLSFALFCHEQDPENSKGKEVVDLLKRHGAHSTRDDIKAPRIKFGASSNLIATFLQHMPFHHRYRNELIIGGALAAAGTAAFAAYKKFFSKAKLEESTEDDKLPEDTDEDVNEAEDTQPAQ